MSLVRRMTDESTRASPIRVIFGFMALKDLKRKSRAKHDNRKQRRRRKRRNRIRGGSISFQILVNGMKDLKE